MAVAGREEPPAAASSSKKPPPVIHVLSDDEDDAVASGAMSSPPISDGDSGSCRQNRTRSLKEIEDEMDDGFVPKRLRLQEPIPAVPVGFLAPLPVEEAVPLSQAWPVSAVAARSVSRQFWKAGEIAIDGCSASSQSFGGMDRVRVHPRFLHSNATSHKWALGAFAELLDNALDEVCNGATYVLVDMLTNTRDDSKMLLVEDNGGGMTSDKLRHCMSLGYSAKSGKANTIGQYGNGFKTSTMRLGADVIVFSRCRGTDGKSASQSIGMLSYTFLRSTCKEDIVVPMIDYEKRGEDWHKVVRSSSDDWSNNLETILQWSPFTTESDLLQQFDIMKHQGTRIIIYNLWEDDEGKLELDFETDPHDIQIRGVNRDEQSLKMATMYPNSRHFLTYKHSLRSYASILYLRLPPEFRIILRGVDVQHHNIVNDIMFIDEVTYRPLQTAEVAQNDSAMVADVIIGFVKDAHFHIDIQGFNVYHKNRLIKPFWRVWNAAGSAGRGVIGVLEANFVEPAHDKQGFERTIALSRLEARLVVMQKKYWNNNSHRVGYSDKRQKNKATSPPKQEDGLPSSRRKSSSRSAPNANGYASRMKSLEESDRKPAPIVDITDDRGSPEVCSPRDVSQLDTPDKRNTTVMASCSHQKEKQNGLVLVNGDGESSGFVTEDVSQLDAPDKRNTTVMASCSHQKEKQNDPVLVNGDGESSAFVTEGVVKVKEEKHLPERVGEEAEPQATTLRDDLILERERRKSLEKQLIVAEKKIEELEKEQVILTNMIIQEKKRGAEEEEILRKKLTDSSVTIDQLLAKLKRLQRS